MKYFITVIKMENKEAMDTSSETADENQEKFHAAHNFPPPPVVRVPVKHANLGIRSHSM